ncbi:MAG: hypothetical protein ACR2QR_06010, partial [Woeseiaceae bacterium]
GLFGWYFIQVFKVLTSNSSEAAATLPMVLVGVVITLILIEIAYHVVIAVGSRPEDGDERDALIEAKATRIAYFVLAAGCVTTIGHTILNVYIEPDMADRLLVNPIMTANFILLSFILAEITGFAMQLYYYGRGV